VKHTGIGASLLVVCALAGVLAAVALAADPPPATTTGTTTTAPTTTATTPTGTTTTGTTTTATTTGTTTTSATIATGVTVGGVRVGGLTPEDATTLVADAFASPIVLRYGRATFSIAPELLGASAAVDRALTRAQVATPGSALPLPVSVDGAAVREFIGRVADRLDRKPLDAQLVLRQGKPWISKSQEGRTIDRSAAVRAAVAALSQNHRAPIQLRAKITQPAVSRQDFGPVIVIHRGANRLDLYRGVRLTRSFGVATGQSVYPTPLGRFQIVVMWENPWWYPPASPWAAGRKPVPPGPDNPLGTRWMGISSPGVGIHGTPESGSIGYSVSHGCIRMLIPQAEWLFQHVEVGTPVFIVST
jgi:lipoprotein-anchoring transpeptidase ErfK/SrfK